MVLDLKLFGEGSNARRLTGCRQTPERQEQLVLLRF